MLKIFNLKEKPKYIEEISILTQKEWGEKNLSKQEFNLKVQQKILKIKSNLKNFNYCKLILLDDNNLVGFISIFPNDGEERQDLSPWYATMYVKNEYRGKGYSKVLNAAIIEHTPIPVLRHNTIGKIINPLMPCLFIICLYCSRDKIILSSFISTTS